MDLGVQRAAFEHAIAILIGKAPAELTIPPATLNTPPPPVERRPDVANAERQVAAANERDVSTWLQPEQSDSDGFDHLNGLRSR
jgi:hypothetical protein